MFSKDMIDFDKLHGEIKSVLARQKELRALGVKGKGHGNGGHLVEYTEMTNKPWYKDHKEVYKLEWEASYLSCRMTVLCAILAQAKGKVRHKSLHKKFWRYKGIYWTSGIHPDSTSEERQKAQEKLIGDEWKQFLKEEKPAPEASGEFCEQEMIAAGYTKREDKGLYYTLPLEPVEPIFSAPKKKSVVEKIWDKLTR